MSERLDYLLRLSQSVFSRFSKSGFDKLTRAEQRFFCLWSLQGEVENGGFDQYLFNSSGDYTGETISALEDIQLNEVADIVRRASLLLGDRGAEKDRLKRQKQLDALSDTDSATLRSLDKKFYEKSELIEEAMYKLAVEHEGEFPSA